MCVVLDRKHLLSVWGRWMEMREGEDVILCDVWVTCACLGVVCVQGVVRGLMCVLLITGIWNSNTEAPDGVLGLCRFGCVCVYVFHCICVCLSVCVYVCVCTLGLNQTLALSYSHPAILQGNDVIPRCSLNWTLWLELRWTPLPSTHNNWTEVSLCSSLAPSADIMRHIRTGLGPGTGRKYLT